MRKVRVTKRIPVVAVEDTVLDAEVDWKNILLKADRDVERVHREIPDISSVSSANWLNAKTVDRRRPIEDIAFSTIAAHSESDLRKELQGIFSNAKDSLAVYQRKHDEFCALLREYEGSKLDVAIHLEELEQENDELRSILMRHTDRGKPLTNAPKPSRQGWVNQADVKRDTKDELRRELLLSDGDAMEDAAIMASDQSRMNRLLQRLYSYLPFEKELRTMKGSMGTSIGYYFNAFRSLCLFFLFIGLITIIPTIYHLSQLNRSEWFVLDNFIPRFMQYSSFSSPEGTIYAGLILFDLGAFVIFTALKLFEDDRVSKILKISKLNETHVHSDVVLMAWDNNISSEADADELSSEKSNAMKELLEDSMHKGGSKTDRSQLYRFLTPIKRIIGALVYVCIQFSCYLGLSFLTTVDYAGASSDSSENSSSQILRILTVPVVISVYNNIFPYIIQGITNFENWDSELSCWILTIRLYISALANVLMLAIIYGLLADPMLLAMQDSHVIRQRLEQEFYSSRFKCRLDQTADGMVINILVDISVYIILNAAVQFLRQGYTYVSGQDMKKIEFDLSFHAVSLSYLIGLVTLSIPFVPLVVIFVPVILFVRFKFEAFLCIRYMAKPRKSLEMHQLRKIFPMLVFITVALIGICSASFFLATRSLPKTCDIQDRFIHLCSDAINPVTNMCTLDSNSVYYDLYSRRNYCKAGYPACICLDELACGPFVDDYSALDPLRDYIKSIPTLSVLWFLIAELSVVAWITLIVVAIVFALRTNSYRITKMMKSENETKFQEQVTSISSSISNQNRIISRAKELH